MIGYYVHHQGRGHLHRALSIAPPARLHGVPVVGFTAPGRRDDAPHALGFGVCSALVGAWPDGLTDQLLPGVPDDLRARFTAVGGCSRLPVTTRRRAGSRLPGQPRHVVVMAGDGGDGFTPELLELARAQTPGWRWTVLSRRLGTWHADPAAVLATADVAVIHAGQNSVAEVAALQVPAVVVPAPRPFDEQATTAAALARGWPAVVVDAVPHDGWPVLLDRAAQLDGTEWKRWCDGRAPERVAALVRSIVEERRAA